MLKNIAKLQVINIYVRTRDPGINNKSLNCCDLLFEMQGLEEYK